MRGRRGTPGTPANERRQWGSDRRGRQPLPAVAPPVSDRRIAMARLSIGLTIAAWLTYVVVTVIEQFVGGKASSARLGVEAVAYLLVITALTGSAIAYLITRIGYFYRTRAHRRTPRASIDDFLTRTVPTVTVLVPSYKEDERVIRTTLLSAALQEHPHLRVVLLIDDPHQPAKAHDRKLLESARSLPARIEADLAVPLSRVRGGLEHFEQVQMGDRPTTAGDMVDLAQHYEFAAGWLRGLAGRHEVVDHSDVFFVEHVIGALARDLESVAEALHEGAAADATLGTDRILQLYRRLVAIFRAELSSFERKRYVSSSHEANKAMNLNSYIALMGRSFQEIATPLGPALIPCTPGQADLTVPDPDYVLTLDADSVLLPEYCVRLVYLMEQNEYAQVGVMQTPYSSYPGSATRIERMAGATTDIQHIVHQGMTQYDATFWVGANAVLRKRALDSICEVDYAENWEIRRYIQDRTVIEDTESTIDLGIHGWDLHNYPERLAYSATPPDFGSLAIQRQRWANGGLLIMSKLRRKMAARKARAERNRFGEIFLRINYLASISWASLSLIVLLVYPFNAGLLKPFLPAIALPYFLAMASDLKLTGYKRLDAVRTYGFNLILLPVNLSGTLASILQQLTGEKSSFKRTPKVRDRTTAQAWFIIAPLLLVAFSAFNAIRDIERGQWVHLFFAGLNAVLGLYGVVAFIGVRNSIVDLWVQLRSWLYQPVSVKPARPGAPAGGDWATVLQYGAGAAPARPGSMASARGADVLATPRPRASFAASGEFAELTFFTVFQPIVDLATREPVGFEALTRFADGRSFDEQLAEAKSAGMGVELDAQLALVALGSADSLPDEAFVAVNISPELARETGKLAEILGAAPRPLVLELGGATIGDVDPNARLSTLPGVQIAIDDVGAGYDTLAVVDQLRPAFLKLHRRTVSGLESDPARQAFVRSLVEFAEARNCRVIGEGVETEAECDALRQCGVSLGQGYFVGRPVPIDHVNRVAASA